MMQEEDDGWEDVTDPVEIKKLMGVKGVQGMVQAAKDSGKPAIDHTKSAPEGLSGAELKAWQKGRASLETLGLLNTVRTTYDKDFSKGGPSGLAEYNPFIPKNQDLDGKIASLLGPAKAAYRVDGEGAFSDTDIKLLMESMPNRWSFDGKNQSSMKGMDAILRGHIRTGFGAAGLSAEDIARATGENIYMGGDAPAAPPAPVDRNAMLDQMVKQGRTPQEIIDFLKESGSDPAAVEAQRGVITADRNYRFANPGKPSGPALTIPDAPPSAGSPQRPDAEALRAKYGLK